MTSSLPPSPYGDELAQNVATLQRRIEVARGDGGGEPSELLAVLETAHEELRVADEEVQAQREAIGRLVESHRSLRVQQERMLAILPLPVVVTDARGVVRSANAVAARLINIRVIHLLGKPIFSLFSPEDRADLRRLVAAGTRHGAESLPFRRTATLLPRRGDPVVVELTGSLQLPGASDGEIAWVVLAAGSQAEDPLRATDTLARLATLAHEAVDDVDVLTAASSLCATSLGAAVTLTLGPPLTPTSLASSSRAAQLCDGAQVASGEGPSAHCHDTGAFVSVPEVATDDRWCHLRGRLPDDIGSIAVTPIESGDRVVGTLTAYGPVGWVAPEDVMGLLAMTIGAVLHEMELHRELGRLEKDMERALASRAVIEQAKGIVMAARGVDAAGAWEHLLHLSSTQHVKVRDVAQQIVNRTSGRA